MRSAGSLIDRWARGFRDSGPEVISGFSLRRFRWALFSSAFLLSIIQIILIILVITDRPDHLNLFIVGEMVCLALVALLGYTLHYIAKTEKTLQNNSTWLRLAYQATNLGAWRLDFATQQVQLDERSAIHLGFPGCKSVALSDILTQAHPDHQNLLSDKIKNRATMTDSVNYSTDIRIKGEDGSYHWVEIKAQVYYSGELGASPIIMAVGTSLDITDRKRSAQDLDRLTQELVRSNTELDQFASIVSHDLQEPLRGMSGMLRILKRDYQDRLDPQGLEIIDLAVDSSVRMKQQIEGLLAYSRVKSHGHPFELTDSSAIIEMVLASLNLQVQENQAVIHVDHLPQIMADPIQLAQVFQNLISNAIKFCKSTPPEIQITASQVDHFWQFAVQDNGIGIEPQHFERIFIIFRRLHTQDEYPGNGIGLSICQRIITRHGGRIWVESTPGLGSTFFFTIPIPEPQ